MIITETSRRNDANAEMRRQRRIEKRKEKGVKKKNDFDDKVFDALVLLYNHDIPNINEDDIAVQFSKNVKKEKGRTPLLAPSVRKIRRSLERMEDSSDAPVAHHWTSGWFPVTPDRGSLRRRSGSQK